MTKQKTEISIFFATIKEWFAGRITRSECERKVSVYATAEQTAKIMAVADANKATVQHMSWRPLTESDVAKAAS